MLTGLLDVFERRIELGRVNPGLLPDLHRILQRPPAALGIGRRVIVSGEGAQGEKKKGVDQHALYRIQVRRGRR